MLLKVSKEMKLASSMIGLGIAVILVDQGFAQQGREEAKRDQSNRIFIGQSLESTRAALRNCSIEVSEGGFAFAQTDPDLSNLYFTLDPNHVVVCADFSKAKSIITSISLVCFPSRKQRSTAGEVWLAAEEITVSKDRSYSVKFEVPITVNELERIEKNTSRKQDAVFPPSK